jgi:hypothetical protein
MAIPIKRTRRPPEHYVNNRDFSTAVVEYVAAAIKATESGLEIPRVTHYIGDCFLRLAEGLSHKPNFYSYSYRGDMVMDAVENCLKAIHNYDITRKTRTGLPNAFAYFTQISYNAFLRRIAREKHQQSIKDAIMMQGGSAQFSTNTSDYNDSAVLERIKSRHENYWHEDRNSE